MNTRRCGPGLLPRRPGRLCARPHARPACALVRRATGNSRERLNDTLFMPRPHVSTSQKRALVRFWKESRDLDLLVSLATPTRLHTDEGPEGLGQTGSGHGPPAHGRGRLARLAGYFSRTWSSYGPTEGQPAIHRRRGVFTPSFGKTTSCRWSAAGAGGKRRGGCLSEC